MHIRFAAPGWATLTHRRQAALPPNRFSRMALQCGVACLALFAGPFTRSADIQPPSAGAPPHAASAPHAGAERLRLIIETDAGGDPDDEQSLVRFLLYANEWDIQGIIANRPQARGGENRNPERTGLGVVRRLLTAYGECHPNLVRHDSRYPSLAAIWGRTVAGYDDTDDAVKLIIAAVDDPDPRPIWYSDWGTDHGAATNNLKRALDRIRSERGQEGYARFKSRLRLASYDCFREHTTTLDPPFPLWVDTFRPELDRKRWYHRFSALTARAGGFDLVRDCLAGHGSLGALYPTNTTHGQKEGDTMTFLYLVPTGMNDPLKPQWGSWAGRYGLDPGAAGKPYFWANQVDGWNSSTNRDNTLLRWAADLQNDFRARLDWCVKAPEHANHPPSPQLDVIVLDATGAHSLDPEVTTLAPGSGIVPVTLPTGKTLRCDAAKSRDPDGDLLSFQWFAYPEAGTRRSPITPAVRGSVIEVTSPQTAQPKTVHYILRVTDNGDPPLSRYRRLVVTLSP